MIRIDPGALQLLESDMQEAASREPEEVEPKQSSAQLTL